ncbi:MAG: chemotaxis protein CheA [Bdellovibrionales bacterium]|nr:chemotaxis protein CheA [Massilia sp.]
MNPLLTQFLAEARDFLQGIAEKLMQLEQAPDDADLMVELFRLVHTLKGNSGLFDFPDMTRVLHAGEDLMDAVRNGRIAYSQQLADQLLDAMDFVGILCDEVELAGRIDASRAADSAKLAGALRALTALQEAAAGAADGAPEAHAKSSPGLTPDQLPLAEVAEAVRLSTYLRAMNGETVHWITYRPLEECFFQGDDPFFTARQTPDILWGRIVAREPWLPLAELDAYRCVLEFQLLTCASRDALAEHYRYVPDQVDIVAFDAHCVVIPQGNPNGGPVYDDFVADALHYLDAGELAALKQATLTMLHLSNPDLWLSSALRWVLQLIDSEPDNQAALRRLIESMLTLTAPQWDAAKPAPAHDAGAGTPPVAALPLPRLCEEDAGTLEAIFAAQRQILMLGDHPPWHAGRLKAVGAALVNCCKATDDRLAQEQVAAALQLALATASNAPLLAWLVGRANGPTPAAAAPASGDDAPLALSPEATLVAADEGPKFNRRADDATPGTRSLKVDQAKVDLLMNLIGEMVVSKNALPYLAQRAEEQFGVRELAREIKAQYAVINRIAEEMQSAIMQVRMMPVSFVFQRFPRLVRDISRKLGKEVQLVLEGEETEADKNIIESLADPLVHIVRNSLDHGLETPDLRRASGKPAQGSLTIRAIQQGDQVLIEIIDDGKGIDPAVIKRKAYEKGMIDEAMLERISDRDALNLVFAAGFSTAEVVSDLSGRGVGMDVVRTAVEKVNGTIVLESEVGKGTRICISLPLSMAVTQAMIVESDRQFFGVPMDHVVETVRIPSSDIRTIKRSQTIVLRGKIIPLKALNVLLGLPASPRANAYNEMAVLVTRVGGESVGLIVDDFRKAVDVIQKPLSGVLAGLSAYSGSALMGDGSVLMMLNVKEII